LTRPSKFSLACHWLRTHPYTVLAVVFFLVYAVPFHLKKYPEWQTVYVAAANHLLSGEHLYKWSGDYLVFVYPPFAALVAVPFAALAGGHGLRAGRGPQVYCAAVGALPPLARPLERSHVAWVRRRGRELAAQPPQRP